MLCKANRFIWVLLLFVVFTYCGRNDSKQALEWMDSIELSISEIDTTFGSCDTAMCHQIHVNYPVVKNENLFNLQEQILSDMLFWEPVEIQMKPSVSQLISNQKKLYDDVNSDDGFAPMQNWYLTIDVHTDFNKAGVFSYTVNKDAFFGGAHPLFEAKLVAYKVNPDSLIPLTWDDIIQPDSLERFVYTAKQSFFNYHGLDPFLNVNDQGFWFESGDFELNDNFSIHEDGIAIMYNPYEVASYAAGTTSLFLDWKEVEPWLKPSFVAILSE